MDTISDDVARAFEELTAMASSMAERLDELSARNARLEAEVAALRQAKEYAPVEERAASAAEESPRRRAMSRRQLIGLAGAGAAGASLAIGSSVLHAQPAAAAASADGDLHLGGTEGDNYGGTTYTGIGANNNGPVLFASNQSSLAQSEGVQALATVGVHGYSFTGLSTPGVLGTNSGAWGGTGPGPAAVGIGVKGEIITGGGQTPTVDSIGVVGSNEGLGPGVLATSEQGTGLVASGFDTGVEAFGRVVGVHGSSLDGSTSPAVVGTVRGKTEGVPPFLGTQGDGVRGEAIAGGGPTPLASSNGVVGSNEGLGTGVKAISTSGLGVSAQGGQAPLLLVPAATAGAPTTGTHAKGELYVDSTGVLFLCTAAGSPGTWLRNITSDANIMSTSGPGMQVNQGGLGSAVVGNVTNAASNAIAMYGVTNGTGQALKGYQSGSGIAVYAQLNNAANANPAVYANTNGKGPGVQTNQTGTGYGLLGNIANAANSLAAVRGVTNGTGPALQGAGGRAQLNLAPGSSSSPPASGQKGDFFVDSSGRLFYSKGGAWVTLVP